MDKCLQIAADRRMISRAAGQEDKRLGKMTGHRVSRFLKVMSLIAGASGVLDLLFRALSHCLDDPLLGFAFTLLIMVMVIPVIAPRPAGRAAR